MVDWASTTLASSNASLFLGPSPNEVLVAGLKDWTEIEVSWQLLVTCDTEFLPVKHWFLRKVRIRKEDLFDAIFVAPLPDDPRLPSRLHDPRPELAHEGGLVVGIDEGDFISCWVHSKLI